MELFTGQRCSGGMKRLEGTVGQAVGCMQLWRRDLKWPLLGEEINWTSSLPLTLTLCHTSCDPDTHTNTPHPQIGSATHPPDREHVELHSEIETPLQRRRLGVIFFVSISFIKWDSPFLPLPLFIYVFRGVNLHGPPQNKSGFICRAVRSALMWRRLQRLLRCIN